MLFESANGCTTDSVRTYSYELVHELEAVERSPCNPRYPSKKQVVSRGSKLDVTVKGLEEN